MFKRATDACGISPSAADRQSDCDRRVNVLVTERERATVKAEQRALHIALQ